MAAGNHDAAEGQIGQEILRETRRCASGHQGVKRLSLRPAHRSHGAGHAVVDTSGRRPPPRCCSETPHAQYFQPERKSLPRPDHVVLPALEVVAHVGAGAGHLPALEIE
ncbi:MAG: hypothetical protein R2710_04190 [Acidimicrobiales bacterium]